MMRTKVNAGPGSATSELINMLDPQPWMKDGTCRTVDPAVFFPDEGQKDISQKARAICLQCPVIIPCGSYALGLSENPDGIWGGTTKETRRLLRKERAA